MWGFANMARAYHEALGISFPSTNPHKCLDVLLYELSFASRTEVISRNLASSVATLSFAMCDLVSRDPASKGSRKTAGTQLGASFTPKKQPPNEKFQGMAMDEKARRDNTQVSGALRVGADKDDA